MDAGSSAPSKRARLSEALTLVPWRKLDKLKRLLKESETTEQEVNEQCGFGQRAATTVLKPLFACYSLMHLPGEKEKTVSFHMGDLNLILHYILESAESYRCQFEKSCRPRGVIDLALYADECTGGNIVKIASSKQCLLIHWAITNVGHLQKENCWFPLAAMPVRDLKEVRGGLSAVFAELCRQLHQQMQQTFHYRDATYRFNVQAFIGDYDAVAKTWSATGAAGLKPCLLCQNVTMRRSTVPTKDSFFQSISSACPETFQRYNQEELNQEYDRLLENTADLCKSKKEKEETLFGFKIHSDALLHCQTARTLLPLSKIIFDSLHCYYSNGCCSAEIVLVANILQERFHISIEDIRESVGEVQWHCSLRSLSTSNARRFLFHESMWKGEFYKGGATEVWYVFPLFHYYVHVLTSNVEFPERECLQALMEAI